MQALDYRSSAEKRRGGGSTKSGGGAEGEEEDEEDDDEEEDGEEEEGREEEKVLEAGLALASVEGGGSGSVLGAVDGVDKRESGKDDRDEGVGGAEAGAGVRSSKETKAEEGEASSVSVDIKKVSSILD